MLGASLEGVKRYAEAEPLLLAAYDGMLQRRATIPWESRDALSEAAQRIILLYREWGKPDQATAWRQKAGQLAQAPTSEAGTPAAERR